MIELQNVSKVYRSLVPPKPVRAVRRMTLTFEAGEVVGIAGPNGAGKSTLINLMLGFLNPSAGSVTIDGQPPRRFVERRGIAYVPELVAIPPWWRVTGALARYAVLSGVPRSDREERVEKAIAALGLEEHRGKRVKQLSKGNRQRLGIAQALLSDADVVVFDEPTHGLDPVWTDRFRHLVRDLRRPERCVVIASHNLHELERMSDRVAILDHGKLTKVADLQAHVTSEELLHYVLDVESDDVAVADVFPAAQRISEKDASATWAIDGDLDALNAGLRALLERGATVRGFSPRRSRLESAFLEAVGES